MSATILRPIKWERRYELRVWKLHTTDYSGSEPADLPQYWEVARCPHHMDWVDPLIRFDIDDRDQAVAWAQAYVAGHPNHYFGGVAE